MHQAQQRILERAAQLIGGAERLAAHLEVSPLRVKLWMEGHATLPGEMFLKVADLLFEYELRGLARGGAAKSGPAA